MTTGRDDDAFSWEGDDDPTLRAGEDVAPVALPKGYTAVGKGSGSVLSDGASATDVVEQSAATAPAQAGNAALVALGVLGGVYLLYTIGWIIGGLRLQGVAAFLLSSTGAAPPTWQAGNLVMVWLAVAVPPLWFLTVLLVTRASRLWVRLTWLIAGAVLLIPWPLLLRVSVPA